MLAHRRPVSTPPSRVAPLGACRRDTLRCADARDYHTALRPCCRGHVRAIVADTAELLREHGVTFWVDYGTLLGAVRNPLTTWADYPWLPQEGQPAGPLAPGIIPHDKDADFGALASHWTQLMQVRAALERKGYQVQASPHGAKMKVRLSVLNHTNLDIFCWRQRAAGVLYRPAYISVDSYKGRSFPASTLFPLSEVEFEGLRLPAPADPAYFCEFRYGPSWRTPIPANHDGIRRGVS